MFGLFQKRKQRKVRSIPFHRVRLVLESLEERDCPSLTDPSALLPAPPVATVPAQTAVAPASADTPMVAAATLAPNLTLNVAYGTRRMVTLSGQVTDSNPGGLTVNFTGVVTGSVVTKVDGTFSIQLEATALGTVNATTTNVGGITSNTASVEVVSNAPVITDLTLIQGTSSIFTFRGRVIDESAPGLVIHFSGLPSVQDKTVTVEADGTFCYVVQLQPLEEGTVTVVTYDWWGLKSNTPSYIVRQS